MDRDSSTLTCSLLESNTNMNDRDGDRKPNSSSKKDEKNALARAYAHNAPKILLETLSASFEDGNRFVDAKSCDSSNITLDTMWRKKGDWGCTFNINSENPYWVGHIDQLTNVISIELQVKQTNFTSLYMNGTVIPIVPGILDELNFKYDVDLYGCYDNSNCQWQTVLTLRDIIAPLSQIYRPPESSAVLNTFSNTFQNQEALPNKGKVKAYFALVQYYNMGIGIFDGSQEMKYKFLTVTRPLTVRGNIFLILLLTITTITAILYCRAVFSVNPIFKKWLPEQKWLVWYFFALILYQNPVYCVICWQDQPTSVAVFTSYVLDAFGQAAFFIIWLLFSDGLRRKSNYFLFYIPKFIIGTLIFLTNIAVLLLQFPSLTNFDNRSPLEAVNNWSHTLKLVYIWFSISFLMLLVIWIIWWYHSLWSTARTLQRLPYMSTRYLQLSFRFFFLQATLNSPATQSLTSLTDNINTLFRLQTQLLGKQCFLTVYALTLAFLFLPAGLMDIHAVALAATYVINEDEIQDVVKSRKKAIRSMQALSQLAHAKSEVFCVDLALNLLDMAWEAYHDPPGLETESGYGPMNLDRYGYALIDYSYNKEHDTVCVVARHKTLNRIVVAFRGTSSKRHWNDNLNYTKKLVDYSAMGLATLDSTDGMDVDSTQLPSVFSSLSAADGWHLDAELDDSSDTSDQQDDGDTPANIGVALLE
eukprot:gene2489-4842_t